MITLKSVSALSISILLLIFNLKIFPQHQIPFSTCSSGGETQTNSSYNLTSSIGLPIIGVNASELHKLQTGFWQLYLQNMLSDVNEEADLPTEFKLQQNYPNPFNPSTIIEVGIKERTNVTIKIYDLLGSEVTTLVNQEMEQGWYKLTFNAHAYASGFYICRMQAGNYVSTKKMLLIK